MSISSALLSYNEKDGESLKHLLRFPIDIPLIQAYWYLHLNADQEKAYEGFLTQLKAEGLLVPGQDDK